MGLLSSVRLKVALVSFALLLLSLPLPPFLPPGVSCLLLSQDHGCGRLAQRDSGVVN